MVNLFATCANIFTVSARVCTLRVNLLRGSKAQDEDDLQLSSWDGMKSEKLGRYVKCEKKLRAKDPNYMIQL